MNLSAQPVVSDIEFDVQHDFEEWLGEGMLIKGEKVNVELLPWQYKVFIRK